MIRKLAQIKPIAAGRVLAYLCFEMEQEELTQEERDAQFIAVAEALGVKNEYDATELTDLEALERAGLCG